MPEGDVFECCDGVAAHETRHAGNALAVDRVALVRHRGRALLSRLEELLRLADVRALEAADLRCDLLHRARKDGERCDELRVTVALNDLRGKADGREPQFFARQLLDARVDVGVGADRARELTDGDDLLRTRQALDVAVDLAAPQEQLQSERHRLCVNAVRASDARGLTELLGTAAQYFAEGMKILQDDRGGIAHHDAVCRILHVA